MHRRRLGLGATESRAALRAPIERVFSSASRSAFAPAVREHGEPSERAGVRCKAVDQRLDGASVAHVQRGVRYLPPRKCGDDRLVR